MSEIEIAPFVHCTCVIEKELEASCVIKSPEIVNGCRPMFATVNDCVTVCPAATPTNPKLPAE